jgi:16S rRNA processing protein RimM
VPATQAVSAAAATVTGAAALEPAELPADAVEVARVLGAWGVKGGLRLKPFAADPQALFSTKRWFLAPPQAPQPVHRGMPAAPVLLRVIQAREQGDAIVANVQDIDERDLAQALAGWRVFVARSSFPTPGDDEFYWVDLIGLSVRNRQGDELGTVVGLIETGPHCVLRLQPPGKGDANDDAQAGPERLIPFVGAYVDRVCLAERRIDVDWDAQD